MEILDTFQAGWEKSYMESDSKQLWGEVPSPFLEDFLARSDFLPGSLIGDFGCGDGRNTFALLSRGFSVVGVDISRAALNKCGGILHGCKFNSYVWIPLHASLQSLPLGNQFLDGGVCIDALPQISRPRRALQEIQRTLKPGALLLLDLFTRNDCAFGEGEMVGPGSFLYGGTLFQFFEKDECRRLLDGLFTVVEEEKRSWIDPPHIPFRPREHTHEAFVYILRR